MVKNKQVVIPKGMLKAACLIPHDYAASHEQNRRNIVNAVLRWQAKHPFVPTEAQVDELFEWAEKNSAYCYTPGKRGAMYINLAAIIEEWQRHVPNVEGR